MCKSWKICKLISLLNKLSFWSETFFLILNVERLFEILLIIRACMVQNAK